MKIYKVMIDVLKAINPIAKDQKNEMQRFNFRGIDQVYNEINQHFGNYGVFTIPNVLELIQRERINNKGTVMNFVTIRMEYTFCADDGSNVKAVVYGEAADSGDKAIAKAMSIAHKYAILQIFAIPTAEEKDPDFRTPMLETPPDVKTIDDSKKRELLEKILVMLSEQTIGRTADEKRTYLQMTCGVKNFSDLQNLSLEKVLNINNILRG